MFCHVNETRNLSFISLLFFLSPLNPRPSKYPPNVFSVAASVNLPLKNRDEDEVSNPSTLGAVGQL